ncbi:MAG: CinA family protein [Leifsonia sp.]
MPDADPTAALIGLLRDRGLTIAVAESLTGGLLAAELIRIPGASDVVNGGVVAYNTAIKASLLGVDPVLLEERGAVDADVAAQLASGARRTLAVDGRPADVGIGTTGVAGPDPQDGQPVGTAFVGIAIGDTASVVGLSLDGDRAQIRAAVVDAAVRSTLSLLTVAAE